MAIDDLNRYRTGRTVDGKQTFSIPLKPDADGMVGRECPSIDCQPRYFKIGSRKASSEGQSNNDLLCPYCGNKAHYNRFATKEQTEYVKSLVIRYGYQQISNMVRNNLGSVKTSNNGLFKISLEYKTGAIPSVRHYAEKELKRIVECDHCSQQYAVYGIAKFCPSCGKGNLKVHLIRSCEGVKSLVEAYQDFCEKHGREVAYNLLGNCLEDCVSIFEGFLKIIYKKLNKANIGNSFQNLSKANDLFKAENVELLAVLAVEEKEFMELQFAKRHVITHNLGIVDSKFAKQVSTWQASGQDVNLKTDDIIKLLALVERVVTHIID
jgi:hypothetical protein